MPQRCGGPVHAEFLPSTLLRVTGAGAPMDRPALPPLLQQEMGTWLSQGAQPVVLLPWASSPPAPLTSDQHSQVAWVSMWVSRQDYVMKRVREMMGSTQLLTLIPNTGMLESCSVCFHSPYARGRNTRCSLQTHSNCCHKQPSCSCQGNWHNRSFQSQPSLQYSLTPFGQVTMGTLHGSHHPDITHKLNEMPSQLCAHMWVYICLFPPRLEQFLLPFYGSLKQQGPCSEEQGCSGHCLPSPGLHSLGR